MLLFSGLGLFGVAIVVLCDSALGLLIYIVRYISGRASPGPPWGLFTSISLSLSFIVQRKSFRDHTPRAPSPLRVLQHRRTLLVFELIHKHFTLKTHRIVEYFEALIPNIDIQIIIIIIINSQTLFAIIHLLPTLS